MFHRRVAHVLVCALILAVPASADAKAKAKKPKVLPARTMSMRGTVIGTPYVAGTRLLVPVLLQSSYVSKAKLRSPQALISLARTMTFTAPSGPRVSVTYLRSGDAFNVTTLITNATRKATVPQLTVTRGGLVRRGLKLSAAEIEDQLKTLDTGLRSLATYTVGQIADLRAQIAAQKATLATLTSQITTIQTQLQNLPPDQSAQVQAALDQIAALQTQAAGIVSNVGGLQGSVSTLTGQVQFLCTSNVVTGNPLLGIVNLHNLGVCPS